MLAVIAAGFLKECPNSACLRLEIAAFVKAIVPMVLSCFPSLEGAFYFALVLALLEDFPFIVLFFASGNPKFQCDPAIVIIYLKRHKSQPFLLYFAYERAYFLFVEQEFADTVLLIIVGRVCGRSEERRVGKECRS